MNLKKERTKLDAAITALSQLAPGGSQAAGTGKKPGARSYTPAQKKAISKKMKAMWAKRNAQKA